MNDGKFGWRKINLDTHTIVNNETGKQYVRGMLDLLQCY